MQSKKNSFIESITNTLVGMGTTFIFSPLIYWICNVEIKLSQMGLATFFFTILSIARQYVIRRWFNKKTDKNIIVSAVDQTNSITTFKL